MMYLDRIDSRLHDEPAPHADEPLQRQTAHLDELFELAPAAIVLTELDPPRIIRVNREFTQMFGYTPEEAVGRSLRDLIAPGELRAEFARNSNSVLAGDPVATEVLRQRKDGTRIHAHFAAARIQTEHGKTGAYLIYRDITERKRADALLAGENRLLEMIAKGTPLAATLDALCRLVEAIFSGCLASILLTDREGLQLCHGAAPSLPESYTARFDGTPIGPSTGPCGVAAYRRESFIVPDIETYALCAEYRKFAAAHGLRACWSAPIHSSDDRVLGTFAIFYREPRSPSAEEKNTIKQFSHLASIAIERTQAETALRRSEERYALAVNAAGEGHWDWNILTDEFYASPRMIEMYGFAPGTTFAGRADFIARFPFHPEDRPKWDAAAAAHFAGTTARFDLEIRMIPRGETRWIHLTGLCTRDVSGTPVRWTGSVSDVTERKCMEEALRLSEERYALAMEATGDGHWDWNIARDVFYVSPLLLEMSGLPPDTRTGSRAEFLEMFPFHPEDRAMWEAATAAHLEGRTARFDLEMRIVPRAGEVRWIQLTGLCSRNAAGAAVRWAGSVTDVTERKRAETALIESERQLRQAQRLEAMGTLAGGIAHDFNNILGAILGYGEMALRDAPQSTRLRRDVDSIISAGERGRALVDRILAFSRSGVGERVAVHVEEVVHEALRLLSPKLPDGIDIEARLNAGRAAMLGDATQVHQVLMNLAMNGIQAMSAGGLLRISLRLARFERPRTATIGTVAAADYVVLEVADSGTGIPAGIFDRIFDPFFTTKDVGVGTGLGLSLVHGIVTELGGSIDVASTPGTGSVFTVYFPRAGDAIDHHIGETPDVPRGHGERVMIVDDEEALVALATRTLDELGYAPVGFTSAAAALDAVRAEPDRFDAVITDERMPGMSGSVLIREVRAIRRSIPILLVSGYLGGLVVDRAYNSGATDVLQKPLSAVELATSLARALQPG
ncbi:MAG TPA: PAS domain S-box protein [Burkholderiales bacterium]|nr:PAS domain S-box protein [Burkholderiales bacterium]